MRDHVATALATSTAGLTGEERERMQAALQAVQEADTAVRALAGSRLQRDAELASIRQEAQRLERLADVEAPRRKVAAAQGHANAAKSEERTAQVSSALACAL